MGSLVPRLFPSFPTLAVRTANDGKLDGAWGTRLVIQIPRVNLAARTCCRQHAGFVAVTENGHIE